MVASLIAITIQRKNTYLCCVNPILLFLDTHFDLTFYNGFGFTHLFPFGNRFDAVGLEEFHEAPPVISTGSRRLIANWARHSVIGGI